jgi:hypothetical protein
VRKISFVWKKNAFRLVSHMRIIDPTNITGRLNAYCFTATPATVGVNVSMVSHVLFDQGKKLRKLWKFLKQLRKISISAVVWINTWINVIWVISPQISMSYQCMSIVTYLPVPGASSQEINSGNSIYAPSRQESSNNFNNFSSHSY